MPADPTLGASLARILADVSTVFAGDNQGQAHAGALLSDRTAGLNKAIAFNKTQQHLTGSLLRSLNSSPGDGSKTLGAAGLVDPQRIDPFQALALGNQGTEDLIRTQQIERRRVDKALERQQDFSNRMKVLKQQQQLQKDMIDFQIKAQEMSDMRTGRQEGRNLQNTGTSLRNEGQRIDNRVDEIGARRLEVQEAFLTNPEFVAAEFRRAERKQISDESKAFDQARSARVNANVAERTQAFQIDRGSRITPTEALKISSEVRESVLGNMYRKMQQDVAATGKTTQAEVKNFGAMKLWVLSGESDEEVSKRWLDLAAAIPERWKAEFTRQSKQGELRIREGLTMAEAVPFGEFLAPVEIDGIQYDPRAVAQAQQNLGGDLPDDPLKSAIDQRELSIESGMIGDKTLREVLGLGPKENLPEGSPAIDLDRRPLHSPENFESFRPTPVPNPYRLPRQYFEKQRPAPPPTNESLNEAAGNAAAAIRGRLQTVAGLSDEAINEAANAAANAVWDRADAKAGSYSPVAQSFRDQAVENLGPEVYHGSPEVAAEVRRLRGEPPRQDIPTRRDVNSDPVGGALLTGDSQVTGTLRETLQQSIDAGQIELGSQIITSDISLNDALMSDLDASLSLNITDPSEFLDNF